MFRTFGRFLLSLLVLLVVTGAGLFLLFSAMDRAPKRAALPVPSRRKSASVSAVDGRPEVARLIARDLKQGFGVPEYRVEWYQVISGFVVSGVKVTVKTKLAPGERLGRDVCSGVSGWVFAISNFRYNLNVVEVLDRRGGLLVVRHGIGDSCGP